MKMKNRFLRICLLWVSCVSLPLASCTKNNVGTIVLIGEESYVVDMLAAIPDSLKVDFMEMFGSLPDGPVPPCIEGGYVITPKVRFASNLANWLADIPEPDTYVRFDNQHNGMASLALNGASETHVDTVFVMGCDSWYSVCFIEEKNYEVVLQEGNCHVNLSQGVVMKGQVTRDGIRDLTYATIILDMDADAEDAELYAPGTFFIWKDGDGIAERFDW